jgi:hypothetical protein
VLGNSFQQRRMRNSRIGARSAEPKGTRPDRDERSRGRRVAAGKQRDVMSELY